MKGRTDHTNDYRGMSSTVHPRRGSGVMSGEGQFERGTIRDRGHGGQYLGFIFIWWGIGLELVKLVT